ncbi:MAG: hypothetical protein RL508_1160 [Actinomycetota bacterium]|jgi:hypothetical protein
MNIVAIVAAWALTVFLSLVFFKAGRFKFTAPIETLAAAGMAWTKQIPAGLVRTIALLEILGVAGIVLAPIASEFLGFGWAQPWGVAAAAGLTLTMIVGAIMHIVRGEFKYTYKINLQVIAAGLVLTVLLALYGGSVFA